MISGAAASPAIPADSCRLDVPAPWRRATEEIGARGGGRVLLLGAADVGKSSFCAALCRRLLDGGERVAVVDSDVGQKDLGPPATVTLGYPGRGRPLAATPVAELAFVGGTNPARHMLALVAGTLRLATVAEAPFVVVDTSGLVRGPGWALKTQKIEALRPDVLVAIARGRELDGVLAANRHLPALCLRPSRHARRRSRAARAAARQRAFAAYFADAKRRRARLDRLAVQRTRLFTGTPLATQEALYAEDTAEGRVVVGPRAGVDFGKAQVLPAGFERGLLCGLADGRGRDLGLGIVERIDFRARTVAYRSPVGARRTRVMKLGDVRLELDGAAGG